MSNVKSEISAQIGRRLRKVRQVLNLGQKEFAEKLGFSDYNPVSRFERGDRLPTTEVLLRLIECGVDVHWLLTGEQAPTVVALWRNHSRAMAPITRLLVDKLNEEIAAMEGHETTLKAMLEQERRGDPKVADAIAQARTYIDSTPASIKALTEYIQFCQQDIHEVFGPDYVGVNPDLARRLP